MDRPKYGIIKIPNDVNAHGQTAQFETDAPFGIIDILSNPHDDVHHEEKIGVQQTNVVENVGSSLSKTQKDDQEIQSPKHLHDPNGTVILL